MNDLNNFLLSSISEEIKAKLLKILSTIIKLEESYEFLEPVDFVKYNIPDYPEIIKYPKDLGSIKEKLENNGYETIQEFLNDVQLVWDNCHTYNPPSNHVTKSAEICEKKFKKEFEKMFKYSIEPSAEYSNDYIGINEKMELKEKINYLIEAQNYKALNNLKNYCLKIVPHIIEINKETKKYTIIFDRINRNILENIYEIINV